MKKLGVYHKRDVYLLRKDKADKKDIVCEFVSANVILNINKELKKKINATIP